MAARRTSAASRRSAAAPDRRRMGERLRAIRKAHRMTLKALSERSGVALSTLSKIELGQVSASYEKFAAVAHALQVDIAQLFDARAQRLPARAPTVVRSTLADAPGYDTDHYDYRMLATGYPGRRMTPMHGRIEARSLGEFGDFIRHPGQEFIMVLSGRVRIHFETGETVELKRHESAYFDSGTGHVYVSLGKEDAQVLVVMSERDG
jgi:transcriptional regulator with XRE-family HTH domain